MSGQKKTYSLTYLNDDKYINHKKNDSNVNKSNTQKKDNNILKDNNNDTNNDKANTHK